VTAIIDDVFRPLSERLTKLQWLVAGIVIGFFLGFVSTLLIACVIGYLGLQVPAYFGIPTTFFGYFLTGYFLSQLARPEVDWEIPTGILVCAVVFMLGHVGLKGHGVILFLVYFLLLPAIAVGVCYLGIILGREGWAGLKSLVPRRASN
jgi:hypothetical protein